MAFDRTKFKGANNSANKAVQKDAQANNKSGYDNNGRVGFLTIEEGRNVFRMLPPHPEDTIGAAYLPKRVAMLKCEVPVYKDGEDTGTTEVKNKNIFCATQHGGLPKDPVELYIEYVRKRANDEFTEKDKKSTFLAPITGWRDKKGWNWGISPKTSFVAYAVKDGKVGRLELYDSMIRDMDKLNNSEEAGDVIETDPFSDPNEGCELIITKQHAEDKQGKVTDKWEYIITKGEPSRAKRESWDDYFTRTMVTDAQLEELIGQEPLSKIMGNKVYTSRDWDMALDGLRRFDEDNKYGIFDNEEFLDEIQELDGLVVEYKKDDKDIDKAFEKKPEAKNVFKEKNEAADMAKAAVASAVNKGTVEDAVVVDDEQEVDDEDGMTILDMKIALKKYVRKTFGDEYASQVPNGDVQIEKWYEIMSEGEDLPIVTKKVEKVVEKEPEQTPVVKEAVSEAGAINETELSSQISNLRNRRRQQQ